MEDFYGNLYQWLDGLYCDDYSNIKTDYRNSAFTGDDGNSFQFSTECSFQEWYNITRILGTNTSGFVMKNGVNNEGQDYYYCDYGSLNFGFGASGGSWNDGPYAGVFQMIINFYSLIYSFKVGARLMYKHKK